ncbi:MAG: hypothetical protein MUC82_08475 [Cypionkella sp.]|jgi:hypothetical protein|nr:hypothetical protein [Cypionkella sp.]
MKRILCLVALTANPAHAMDDIEAMVLLGNLASLLAAEEFCGMSYSQPAIENWVTENVPPERIEATQLHMGVKGHEMMQEGMSASTKTAHCAAARQTATLYGFVN